MANPVPDATAAKRRKSAPVKWQVRRVVGTIGCRAKPQVPIESLWHFMFFCLNRLLLVDLAVDILKGVAATVDLGYITNRTSPDHFAEQTDVLRGMPLIADLGNHAFFLGGLLQRADFGNGVRKRFFRVNMLAPADGAHDLHRVGVIRSGDQYCVDLIAHLIVHFPEIPIALGLGEFLERVGGTPVVHVTKRNDLLTGHGTQIGATPASDTDCRDADLAVRRIAALGGFQNMTPHDLKPEGGRGRFHQKGTSFHDKN